MNRPLVMGIVNVTPDSFSDGGRYFSSEEAVRRARNMAEEGADIIDLGGESTRPGATPLGWEEEWKRVEPVLETLGVLGVVGRQECRPNERLRISVDTYHPETAERALAAGADMVNCVKSEPVEDMLRLCAAAGAELVLPARICGGVPSVGAMPLADVVRDALGTDAVPTWLWLDPMIGFDTTREEDLALLQAIPELARFGRVLVGASRKRIVKKLTGEKATGKNLGGCLGLAVWCVLHGASAVRVHDVAETVQALKAVESLEFGCREVEGGHQCSPCGRDS